MSLTTATNLAACHRCPRATPPRDGVMTCLENGRTVHQNAEAGACRLDRFAAVTVTIAPRGPLPVDERMLAGYVATAANATEGGCGCSPPPPVE